MSTIDQFYGEALSITDHAGMAAWYEKEADTNRQKAKNMEVMKAAYAKSPGFVQGMAGVGGKTDIPRHCDLLISSYTKVADEADEFAKIHRGMVK